eukprot:13552-Heterococcus_DN1.PRE.1
MAGAYSSCSCLPALLRGKSCSLQYRTLHSAVQSWTSMLRLTATVVVVVAVALAGLLCERFVGAVTDDVTSGVTQWRY